MDFNFSSNQQPLFITIRKNTQSITTTGGDYSHGVLIEYFFDHHLV